MFTYEIIINGKPRKIELTRKSKESFNARIDDKSFVIELHASKHGLDGQFSIGVDRNTYRIDMTEFDQERPFPVKVEEASFEAMIKPALTRTALTTLAPTPLTPTARNTAQKRAVQDAITAPMTGKIISVKVRKGDAVKAGQALCIIEAMKMENEISASKPGTVQDVKVLEGSPVSEGDILFIVG